MLADIGNDLMNVLGVVAGLRGAFIATLGYMFWLGLSKDKLSA
jgi:hypothetical protein